MPICKYCLKEFIPKNYRPSVTPIYCSKSCSNKAIAQYRNRIYKIKEPTIRICKECLKPFARKEKPTKDHPILYCSSNCSSKKHHTLEVKKLMSLKKIEFLNNHPEKHLNKILAMNNKLSKPQLRLFEILKTKYNDAELNFCIKTNNTWRFADVGIPSLKIDYEYDSEYWHKDKDADNLRQKEIEEVNIHRLKLGGFKG